jgi:hypothetical protein
VAEETEKSATTVMAGAIAVTMMTMMTTHCGETQDAAVVAVVDYVDIS